MMEEEISFITAHVLLATPLENALPIVILSLYWKLEIFICVGRRRWRYETALTRVGPSINFDDWQQRCHSLRVSEAIPCPTQTYRGLKLRPFPCKAGTLPLNWSSFHIFLDPIKVLQYRRWNLQKLNFLLGDSSYCSFVFFFKWAGFRRRQRPNRKLLTRQESWTMKLDHFFFPLSFYFNEICYMEK